jgi:hypothetical protein
MPRAFCWPLTGPMTDAAAAPAPRSRPTRRTSGGLAWLALLLALAVAAIVGSRVTPGTALQLANPDPIRSAQVRAVFAQLPDRALVLVAMDPDLGTYAEIRPTLRAAFDDLRQRGASLAFVSVSAEGRAIAAAELERLRVAGASGDSLMDLGFVAGAEAGMVRLVGDALPVDAAGRMAEAISAGGGGIGAFQMMLLVGGTDVGPRSWVEQVGTRLPDLPMIAVAPTFLQPELAPYLRTGQLAGLLATVRDGAAFTEAATDSPNDRPPSALAMLVGLLVAIVVLGRQLLGSLPGLGAGPAAARLEEEQP